MPVITILIVLIIVGVALYLVNTSVSSVSQRPWRLQPFARADYGVRRGNEEPLNSYNAVVSIGGGVIFVMWVLFCAHAMAQVIVQPNDPIGPGCSAGLHYNSNTGQLWGCQNSQWSKAGGTSAAIACAGTPGNTIGTYRQQCQTTTGAIYACNNVAGCTVAADWVAAGSLSIGDKLNGATPGQTLQVGTSGNLTQVPDTINARNPIYGGGLKTDGSDSSPALQAIFNAAIAAGSKVRVPAGTYDLYSKVTYTVAPGISAVLVDTPGTGYSNSFAVTFTQPTDGGTCSTLPTATATASGGAVQSVAIVTAGSCTGFPIPVFTAGGGSGATGEVRIPAYNIGLWLEGDGCGKTIFRSHVANDTAIFLGGEADFVYQRNAQLTGFTVTSPTGGTLSGGIGIQFEQQYGITLDKVCTDHMGSAGIQMLSNTPVRSINAGNADARSNGRVTIIDGSNQFNGRGVDTVFQSNMYGVGFFEMRGTLNDQNTIGGARLKGLQVHVSMRGGQSNGTQGPGCALGVVAGTCEGGVYIAAGGASNTGCEIEHMELDASIPGSIWVENCQNVNIHDNEIHRSTQVGLGAVYGIHCTGCATGKIENNQFRINTTTANTDPGSLVSAVNVTAGGSGYTANFAVTFTGGCTTAPTATAIVSGGAVSWVQMLTGGINCTSAPTVSFSNGAGSGAAGTAILYTGVQIDSTSQYIRTINNLYSTFPTGATLWSDAGFFDQITYQGQNYPSAQPVNTVSVAGGGTYQPDSVNYSIHVITMSSSGALSWLTPTQGRAGREIIMTVINSSGANVTIFPASGAGGYCDSSSRVLVPSQVATARFYYDSTATCWRSIGDWVQTKNTQVATTMYTDQNETAGAFTFDFSGAAHTLPQKKGILANLPGTCTVGETYFATDAPAGQNLYGCTATNTWTAEVPAATGYGTVQTQGTSQTQRATINVQAGLVAYDTGSITQLDERPDPNTIYLFDRFMAGAASVTQGYIGNSNLTYNNTGTPTLSYLDASWPFTGGLKLTTAATSGNLIGLTQQSANGSGRLPAPGAHGNTFWELYADFQLNTSTTPRHRIGFGRSCGTGATAYIPTDGFYVRADNQLGTPDTNFMLVSDTASVETTQDTGVAIDTTLPHRLRVRSDAAKLGTTTGGASSTKVWMTFGTFTGGAWSYGTEYSVCFSGCNISVVPASANLNYCALIATNGASTASATVYFYSAWQRLQ